MNPHDPITAVLPASSARLAADYLSAAARAEDDPGIADRLAVAAAALHAAGWSHVQSTDALVARTNELCEADRQISAHIPAPQIERWLTARGWSHDGQGWHAPDGTRIWQTDEAFQLQLIAEVDR